MVDLVPKLSNLTILTLLNAFENPNSFLHEIFFEICKNFGHKLANSKAEHVGTKIDTFFNIKKRGQLDFAGKR